jgi:hypothetical protein
MSDPIQSIIDQLQEAGDILLRDKRTSGTFGTGWLCVPKGVTWATFKHIAKEMGLKIKQNPGSITVKILSEKQGRKTYRRVKRVQRVNMRKMTT